MSRRWASEERVLEELERLNDASMEQAREFKGLAVEAAEAEATHKAMRAKAVLAVQAAGKAATGKAVSVAQAEVHAEADDDVAAAYLARLTSAALAEACRENLRSIRSNQEALRTAAASARDSLTSPGFTGRR